LSLLFNSATEGIIMKVQEISFVSTYQLPCVLHVLPISSSLIWSP